MTKVRYMKRPAVKTPLGTLVLRVRLSLRETQKEFAQRFRVSHITIHNWERGRVKRIQRLYKEILDSQATHLAAEGRLIPEEILDTVFREAFTNVD